MTPSRTSRGLFVGSLVTASVAVVALTGGLVGWPMYRDHLALEPIRRALKNRDSWGVDAAVDALRKTNQAPLATRALMEGLRSPDNKARILAVRGLHSLGAEAEEAIPALIEALGDAEGQVRKNAAVSLTELGRIALPALLDGLKHENEEVRGWCAEAIGDIGDEAKDAVPALWAVAQDETEIAFVRKDAAIALSKLDPGNPATIEALVAALGNLQSERFVCAALERIGEPAVPRLIRALRDETVGRRAGAARTLMEIGQTAAIPALVDALGDENAYVRGSAANALGRFGAQAADAIPALLEALSDEYVRLSAARALCAIEPSRVNTVVPLVVDWAKASDPAMAYNASELLQELGTEAEGAIRLHVKALMDEDAAARERAARALAGFGLAADSAVPALTNLLSDADAVVRVSAALALWKIDGQTEAAVRVLAAALRSEDLEARRRAAWILGEIGPAAKAAAPALVRALKDSDPTVSQGAGYSLGRIDPTATWPSGP